MAKARKMGRPRLERTAKKSEGIGIRVRPELRTQLEISAASAGRSLSNEVAYRLEASFAQESAYGGPKLTELAHLMAARFIAGGLQAGETMFGPGVTEEKWLADPYCYDNALIALIDTLWARRPNRTWESDTEMFNRLQGRISTRWAKERERR